MEKASALLRFYREWIAEAPDELTTILIQRRAPALESVPPELRESSSSGSHAAMRERSRRGRKLCAR